MVMRRVQRRPAASRPRVATSGRPASGARPRRRLPRSIVRRNRHWAKKLRLRPQVPRIARTIGVSPRNLSADTFVAALKAWQQANGMEPSGVLGPRTWDAMSPAAGQPAPAAPLAPADEPSAEPAPDGAGAEPHAPECQCPVCNDEPAAEPGAGSEPQEEVWDWLSGWASKIKPPPAPAAPSAPAPSYAPPAKVDRSSPAYGRWVQTALNRILGLKLVVDGIIGTKSRAAIRDFQTRQGLPADGVINDTTEQALIRAGAGSPPAATAPSSSGGVNTALPASGPGFYAKPESWPVRQYGLAPVISAIQTIGRAWVVKHPSGPRFGITDISQKGGGPFPPHSSHQKGTDVDLRPLRSDGVETGTNYKDPSYSRTLTQDFVNVIRSSSPLPIRAIYFNDTAVTGRTSLAGHDDHLHIAFETPTSGTGGSTSRQTTATAQPAGSPALIRSESTPPAGSYYFDIRLGSEGPLKPMTGVYFPRSFQPASEVDFLIYFHGHRIEKKNVKESIDAYWRKDYAPYFPLREALNETGKPMILVAPSLGPRSQYGWLGQKGGLDRYVDSVLSALRSVGPLKGRNVSVRHIVLACHSGGGTVMRLAALDRGKYAARIRECWGFDSLYDSADPAGWKAWAKVNPKGKAYFYYSDPRTGPNVQKLKTGKPASITIQPSDRSHMWAPLRYWKERIEGFKG